MSTVCAAGPADSRPDGGDAARLFGGVTASRSPESETMRAWETFPIPPHVEPTQRLGTRIGDVEHDAPRLALREFAVTSSTPSAPSTPQPTVRGTVGAAAICCA